MNDWQEMVIQTMARELEVVATSVPDSSLLAPARRARGRDASLRQVAETLLAEALRNGLDRVQASTTFKELSGGKTAFQVSVASCQLKFVFKVDNSPKLAREARTIQELRTDHRLEDSRSRFPRVYAVRDEFPYAYLMEYFDEGQYPSLDRCLFSKSGEWSGIDPGELVRPALQALEGLYLPTRDDRQQVRMMGEAYYSRIDSSLEAVSKQDALFRSRPLQVDNRPLRAWAECLRVLRERQGQLQELAAPFVTVVHGDPNPGNILLGVHAGVVRDVKFIDVKDWKYGDYLFDAAKVAHFILHTGPVEELQSISVGAITETPDLLSIQRNDTTPLSIRQAAEHCHTWARDLGVALGDAHVEPRYGFAMAANLLGLLPRRLERGYRTESILLYASGMEYLDGLVSVLSRDN